jgi:GT2 family glycosyltransferase
MSATLAKVSVVFITYDRIETLEPTLRSFLARTDYPRDRLELVVSDDASPASVQERIRNLDFDRFCFSKKRSGLGANANRGLAAAGGNYILQLQDDWECTASPGYLRKVVAIMEKRPEIGMLILNEHPADLPVRSREDFDNVALTIYENRPEVPVEKVGDHAYTDWPHIKRRAFIDAIGPYLESPRMWETELDYSRRVNLQRQFFIADIGGWTLFKHIGAELSFNTGPLKTQIATWLERATLGAGLLRAFRWGKAALRRRRGEA